MGTAPANRGLWPRFYTRPRGSVKPVYSSGRLATRRVLFSCGVLGVGCFVGGVAMEDARLAELLVRGLAANMRPDARWYTRTILGPDVRQRLLMGAVCPWGHVRGQVSSCARPHSLTNSVQVRRKRTGANILRAPPRRSANLQQCGPTFETVLHGG